MSADNAFNLDGITKSEPVIATTPSAPVTIPDAKPIIRTKEEAIEYLLKIKARVLEFAGKEGYNPFVWLAHNGVNDLLRSLKDTTTEPSQQEIEAAFSIEYQDPALSTLPSFNP